MAPWRIQQGLLPGYETGGKGLEGIELGLRGDTDSSVAPDLLMSKVMPVALRWMKSLACILCQPVGHV